jgi:hypothetical protein
VAPHLVGIPEAHGGKAAANAAPSDLRPRSRRWRAGGWREPSASPPGRHVPAASGRLTRADGIISELASSPRFTAPRPYGRLATLREDANQAPGARRG